MRGYGHGKRMFKIANYCECVSEGEKVTSKIELCIAEVKEWMENNFLCLNDSETVVIFLDSKFNMLSKEPRIPLSTGE